MVKFIDKMKSDQPVTIRMLVVMVGGQHWNSMDNFARHVGLSKGVHVVVSEEAK